VGEEMNIKYGIDTKMTWGSLGTGQSSGDFFQEHDGGMKWL